jgi:capsular polysaccharide biosynthesis protein
MELRTYWKILRRRWWLVVAPIIAVAIYVAATYAPPATSYRVVMRFSAGTEPAGLSLDYDRYYPWLTSEYIANGLADVAETGVFAQNVAARLAEAGQEIPASAIQGAIVTDNAQSILVVYLTWPDAEQIVPLAEAVTDELTGHAAAYYPQLEGVQPAVQPLDDPAPAPLPPSLQAQLMGPAIKLGLAVFVGVGLAFLWHYLDPTVHEAEELEALGWEVLARIPRHR